MRFHHLHFYVKDVAFWRRWFADKLAFRSSLEAPSFEVLQQGNIRIRLSGCDELASQSSQHSEVADYLKRHPSGVADVALESDRFDSAVERAISQGAALIKPVCRNHKGQRQCQFQGWADLRHTLVEAQSDSFQERKAESIDSADKKTFLQEIDHVVINVPQGELAAAADWYRRAFDLSYGQQFEIGTAHSGLRSQVLVHERDSLQMPLNEPTTSNSQIEEFLRHNNGAGVQHVALRSADAALAIAHFRSQGLDLIDVPDTYYERLPLRLGCPVETIKAASQQRLLVDWASSGQPGMLLQTFTKPLFSKPTFFFEIIERSCYLANGKPEVAKGFGEGNFQALFEAIERSQLDRERLEPQSLAQESSCEPQNS